MRSRRARGLRRREYHLAWLPLQRAYLIAGQAGTTNTVRALDPNTGGLIWVHGIVGDAQAVAVVGDMVFVGYHRNNPNPDGSFTNNFTQLLSLANGAQLPWDPGLTGNQSNADGGNNGVQTAWYDFFQNRLYVGGAFLSPRQSLTVYVTS